MRSRTSIGIKFLLAIGLFSMAFSLFLVYQTWKTSRGHSEQMIRHETELIMSFDAALEKTIEGIASKSRFDENGNLSQTIEIQLDDIPEAIDEVWQEYPHRMIRASGSELSGIMETAGIDEARIWRQFKQHPSMESVGQKIRLDGADYIARFMLYRNGFADDGLSEPVLKMIAVPTKSYQNAINNQALSRLQILMFGLLGLLAGVYGAYQALIGRYLKSVAYHFKKTADQKDRVQFEHLQIKTNDEIGLIADSYNHLCEKLSVMYQTLESQVCKRTFELQQANKELQDKMHQCQYAEEQANILAHEAMAANRAKSQFLANMSHEIRTPMNAIMGFSEILSESKMSDESKSYVKLIFNSSKILLQLIKDILDFSKIEAGKLEIQIEDCNVGTILAEIESMMRPMAIKKNIQFEVLQCDVVPEAIKADRIRLRQCLINLVNNAIKFTAEGHVYMSVTMEEKEGQFFVRIDVEDTGIGIPENKIDAIFESFTQVDGTMTRKYGGTGLGLTITKKLCELMGASISVHSKENEGSVFSILLPAGKECVEGKTCVWNKYETIDELGEFSQIEKGMSMFSGKVLVAEDNPSNQKLITILLQKMGLEVSIADDGQMAVDQCVSNTFDLILMDMQMPNMNGYEAARQLRDQGLTTPIIAVTANAMMGDEEKCMEAGCDGHISKPIDRSNLTEIIGLHLTAQVS